MTGAVTHPDRVRLVDAIMRELAQTAKVLAREVPASADGLVQYRPSGWTRQEKRELQNLQFDLRAVLARQRANPTQAFPRADWLAFLDLARQTALSYTQALTRGIEGATGRVLRDVYAAEVSRCGLMLAALDEERGRVADGIA